MKKNDERQYFLYPLNMQRLAVIVPIVSLSFLMALSSGCGSNKKSSDADKIINESTTTIPTNTDNTQGEKNPFSTTSTPYETAKTKSTEPAKVTEKNTEDEVSVANSVTLRGRVADFPTDATTEIKAAQSSFAEAAQANEANIEDILQGPVIDTAEGITSDDMVPAQALVSLFLLTDVEYENPIAQVGTDANGDYEVRSEDVRPYLEEAQLIPAKASDDDVIAAFKALGQIQVRALIVKEDDQGGSKVIAIQTIADPNDVDEVTGEPLPVVVDPIVHRAVRAVVEQIREAIGSLRRLGLSDETVASLAENVIKDVMHEIRRVVRESASSKIKIPVGKSPREVIAQQEAEFEVPMDEQAKTRLKRALKSNVSERKVAFSALKKEKIHAVKSNKKAAKLVASLDSGAQGLLSGLKTRLNDRVSEKVDKAFEEASDDAAVAKLYGVSASDHSAIAAAKTVRSKEMKLQDEATLRQFFLNMGLSVVMETNVAGDAGVVAIHMPLPFYMVDMSGLGGQGDDRNIRLFTIGEGSLDTNSRYTNDASAMGVDGAPRYAPRLLDVMAKLLDGDSPDAFQEKVNAAYARIHFSSGSAATDDFVLLERVRLHHMLHDFLQEAMLISQPVMDTIRANKGSKIPLKTLASVIAKHFHWARESVNLTPEGFPIFNDRLVKLPGKGHQISVTEVIKALSLRLGKTARETATLLTEQKGFYAQFATEAIKTSIHQANQLSASDSLFRTLSMAYPTSQDQFKDLIVGGKKNAPAMPYELAKSRVMRGLTSAIPADLFGRKLTGETSVNVRSALFLLDYVVQNNYVIREKEGFFQDFDLRNMQADKVLRRSVPHFNNIKYMIANEETTVASIIAALLNITQIDDGQFFALAEEIVAEGLMGLPSLPEFEAPDLNEFGDEMGAQQDTVSASCVVERHDPGAPTAGSDALGVRIFSVSHDPRTGDYRKGKEVGGLSFTTTTVPGTGNRLVKYHFDGIPSFMTDVQWQEKAYGQDYVMQFDMPSYTTELPELFFWVDGYIPEITLCDEDSPLFIGLDMEFNPLPSLAILSDQRRFFYDDKYGHWNAEAIEGFDLSNFEKINAPIYLTEKEQAEGLGYIDAVFITTDAGYVLKALEKNAVGFAPLYGRYTGRKLHLALTDANQAEPLYGIHTLIGLNARGLIKALMNDDSGLSESVLMRDDPALFDYGRLYLMRDRDGTFWVIEASHLEVYEGAEGKPEAVFEFQFAKINGQGKVVNPEPVFDGFSGFGGDRSVFTDHLFYQSMSYGDWLVLSPPSGYEGPELLPAESASLGGRNTDYAMLNSATDGVFIRFSGRHFDEQMATVSALETLFESESEIDDIPLRLEAGRKGITFAKLRFDKRSSRYVLMQKSDHRSNFIGKLAHGDIVAVFDGEDSNESPRFLGRVVKQFSEGDQAMLGIEWVDYMALQALDIPTDVADIRDVICIDEESSVCLNDALPPLHLNTLHSEPMGSVFDSDFDGVPALFDPNDADPNIPGHHKDKSVSLLSSHLRFTADSAGGVNTHILIETNDVYPGDIKSVNVTSVIFGEESERQTLFTCMPPRLNELGEMIDFACVAGNVDGGVTVTSAQSREGSVAFTVNVPEATLSELDGFAVFRYTVNFNAPIDVEGNPLFCGDAVCPEIPPVKGHFEVLLPTSDQAPEVFRELMVSTMDNAPVSLSPLDVLDLTRGVNISAETIAHAKGYELSIFCPASATGDWLPEAFMVFWADSMDDFGTEMAPSFDLELPWLGGGRVCDFSVRAFLENDAGDFLGDSAIHVDGIQLEGEVIDELDEMMDITMLMRAGDALCLDDGLGIITVLPFGDCFSEHVFFSVESLQGTDDMHAIAILGDGVTHTIQGGVEYAITDDKSLLLRAHDTVTLMHQFVDLNVVVDFVAAFDDHQGELGIQWDVAAPEASFFQLLDVDGDGIDDIALRGGLGEWNLEFYDSVKSLVAEGEYTLDPNEDGRYFVTINPMSEEERYIFDLVFENGDSYRFETVFFEGDINEYSWYK